MCARLDWDDTRTYARLWKQAEGSGAVSLISDVAHVPRRSRRGVDAAAAEAVSRSPREVVAELLSPGRYFARWRFRFGDSEEGGTPMEELCASAVRERGEGGGLWLLHRKVFRMIRRDGVEVGDSE